MDVDTGIRKGGRLVLGRVTLKKKSQEKKQAYYHESWGILLDSVKRWAFIPTW